MKAYRTFLALQARREREPYPYHVACTPRCDWAPSAHVALPRRDRKSPACPTRQAWTEEGEGITGRHAGIRLFDVLASVTFSVLAIPARRKASAATPPPSSGPAQRKSQTGNVPATIIGPRARAPGCWRRPCSFRRSVRPLPSEPRCHVHPGLRHAAGGSVPSSACPRRRIGGKAMAIMRLQMPEPIIPPRPPSPPPKPGPDDMPLPEGTPPVKRPPAPKPWQMRVDAVLAVVREAGRGLSRSDPRYGALHGSGGAGANGLRPPYRPKAGLSTRARSACPERSPRCTSISGSRPLQRWRLRRAAVHD